MRRLNPWVVVPSLAGGLLGGTLGWVATLIGCSPDSCWPLAVFVALASFAVAAIGILVVSVLVVRSFGEWRETEARGLPPPSPGCEVPEEPA